MSGRLLDKYATDRRTVTESTEAESEAPESFGAFGFLRGVHDRATMLELRYKNGNIDAFPYAWLTRASFDPSEGITLRFGSETITLVGRNLNAEARPNVRLFAAIVSHRVPWIEEADRPTAISSSQQAIIIESIAVKP